MVNETIDPVTQRIILKIVGLIEFQTGTPVTYHFKNQRVLGILNRQVQLREVSIKSFLWNIYLVFQLFIPSCLQKEKGGTVSVSTPFFSNATQCNVCGQRASRLELTCITSLSLSYLWPRFDFSLSEDAILHITYMKGLI